MSDQPEGDETADYIETEADDARSEPTESGHSTADTQPERNAEDESPS